MIVQVLTSPWAISAGVGVLLLILARLIDEDKAYETGKAHGKLLTVKMSGTKLGKKAWEKIEGFFQKIGGAYFHGVMDGLDGDDAEVPTEGQGEPK